MLFVFLLFVALTPGVLVTLPKGGKRMTVVYVHAAIFAAILYVAFNMNYTREMFQGTSMMKTGMVMNKTYPKIPLGTMPKMPEIPTYSLPKMPAIPTYSLPKIPAIPTYSLPKIPAIPTYSLPKMPW